MPPIVRPPNNNRAIRLAADIYKKLKSLEENYEQLIVMANRSHKQTIESMLVQLRLLTLTALNIYQQLSGSSFPPFIDNVFRPLPRNYCASLRVVVERLWDVNQDILELQRIVRIDNIDRQLIIMSLTIQSHISSFNKLMMDCIL